MAAERCASLLLLLLLLLLLSATHMRHCHSPLSACSSAAGITRSQERSCCAQLGLEVTEACLAPFCFIRFKAS